MRECSECGANIFIGNECIKTEWDDFYCLDCASERSSDVVCADHDFRCDSCGRRLILSPSCVEIFSDGTNYCDTCAWECVLEEERAP